MITHLAMFAHPNPEKVLVIGGGDGGVLREVVKHDCVKEATLCDIDEVSCSPVPFQSPPRYRARSSDGQAYLARTVNTSDFGLNYHALRWTEGPGVGCGLTGSCCVGLSM